MLSRQDIRVNAASPLVDELGPKETYRRIDHALESSDPHPRTNTLDVSA